MYWFEQSFTGFGPEDRWYHEDCLIYYAMQYNPHFLILLEDLYFFLQEDESKCALALQYNYKMGSYYVSRASTRYRLEVSVNCAMQTWISKLVCMTHFLSNLPQVR